MRLTVHDVARLLNASEKSIYRWVSKKEIPFYRIKEQYRFSKAEVVEWASKKGIQISVDSLGGEADDTEVHLQDLCESLTVGGVHYKVEGIDKDSVLKAVVDLLPLPAGIDRSFLHKILLAREALGSTGVGEGIAIPHVRNPIVLAVERPSVTLCFLANKIDFGAMDGIPVNVLFTIISPTVKGHLHLLSRLAFALRASEFKTAIACKAPKDEILRRVAAVEQGLSSSEAKKT